MDGSTAPERGGTRGAGTVGEWLRSVRRARFVGRGAELALFLDLVADRSPISALFVHGPGGVGKTTLLERFAEIAGGAGLQVVRLDLGTIEPTPPAVVAAIGAALGLDGDVPFEALGAGPPRAVLIDRHEQASPIDSWLREQLLPSFAAGTVVVLAGRTPPTAGWRADPGWHEALHVISLRNLSPAEARHYLSAEAVPGHLHDHAVAMSHGHPLALSLLAELVRQGATAVDDPLPTGLGDAPDLVRSLLRSLLDHVPSRRHRRALDTCALCRFTTEDLLRAALEVEDASELFAWLRDLSFVEDGEHGVFPHDLAREVLEADLRWRDPVAFEHLHRRVYQHLERRARSSDGPDRQRALMDWNFLLRANPFTATFIEWKTYGSVYYDRSRPEDRDALLAIAALHEGHESAQLVGHWFDRQPDAFRVLRADGEEAIGFGTVLALHEASESDITADPGASAMWSYAREHGAPRPGEEVYASRFYIDRDTYQGPSASYSAIIAAWMEKLIDRSRAAWEFLGFWADPEQIEPFMSYIEFRRAPEADFEVGGRRYGVFAHDWRRQPLEEWLEIAARRQAVAGFDPAVAAPAVPVLALSAPDFADAVRAALRDLHRPEALAVNPLSASHLVRSRDSGDAAEVLQDLVEEAVTSLRADPRDEKLYRVLARTYLRPARTHELAAEALDLPLSTYKRHLKRGVERVVSALWQRELHGGH